MPSTALFDFLCPSLLTPHPFMRWFSVFEVKWPISHHDESLCSSPCNILLSSRNRCILPNLIGDDSMTPTHVFKNPVYSICRHYVEPFPFYLVPPSKEMTGTGHENWDSVCHQRLMIGWWREFLPFLVSRATEKAWPCSPDMTSWKLLPQSRLVCTLFLPWLPNAVTLFRWNGCNATAVTGSWLTETIGPLKWIRHLLLFANARTAGEE